MGWKTAGLIRVSGLTDGTDVDVLEAIASFLNEEDGRCFPALESVMLVARKSRNIVRQSIKALCEQGLLSFSAEPGKVRSYVIHVHNLPEPKLECFKEFFRTELGKKGTPVQKLTGFRSEPGSVVNGEGVQKCTPTGFRSEPGGGSEVNPEQGIEQGINREQNKEVLRAPAGAPQPPEMSDDEIADLLESVPQEKGERPPFEKGAHLSEKGDHPSPAPKRKRVSNVQKPESVSEQVWEDFSALRTKRRAPITETALRGIQREAEKAGISLEAALSTCCERGWQGFKAEWYRREKLEQKNASKAEYQLPSNDDWDNFDTAHYA